MPRYLILPEGAEAAIVERDDTLELHAGARINVERVDVIDVVDATYLALHLSNRASILITFANTTDLVHFVSAIPA